jgi:hypothetical protein
MADPKDKKEESDAGEKAKAPAKKAKLITVKSALKKSPTGGDPVALHEKHEDHPNGEVFVYGDKEFEVARTAAVAQAIARGALVEV